MIMKFIGVNLVDRLGFLYTSQTAVTDPHSGHSKDMSDVMLERGLCL